MLKITNNERNILVIHASNLTPTANANVLPYKYHASFWAKKSDIPARYTYTDAHLCSLIAVDNSKPLPVGIITNDEANQEFYCCTESYYGSTINVYGIWRIR